MIKITCYKNWAVDLEVTKFCDTYNLEILCLTKLAHTKFSYYIDLLSDLINHLCISQAKCVQNLAKNNKKGYLLILSYQSSLDSARLDRLWALTLKKMLK